MDKAKTRKPHVHAASGGERKTTSLHSKAKGPHKGVTFEDVWASLQESNREWRERSEELDRLMKETAHQMKETDRKLIYCWKMGNMFWRQH